MMDAATGLLYLGNGQYYDPATGRFLNQTAQPAFAPLVADPVGMILGEQDIVVESIVPG